MHSGGAYCFGPRRTDGLVAPGQLALLNPGQVHFGVPLPDTDITDEMLYVDLACMQTAAADLCEKEDTQPVFRQHIVSNPHLWRRLQHVSRLMASWNRGLRKQSALQEALAHLLSAYGGAQDG